MKSTYRSIVMGMLIDIFDRIGIQTPSNFNKILDFVFDHISKNTPDNFEESDVAFAFKKWIENN